MYNSTFNKEGNLQAFISNLEDSGFIVQEGQLNYVDILKLASEGLVPSCFGNNANAPYAVLTLPPAPNQDPTVGQEPPIGYQSNNPANYPANINLILPGATFKLRPDEAIVLIGQTPPPAYYFSFRSYLGLVENKPGKDYSDAITTGNDVTGYYHMIFASLGDTLSNWGIWTENTPQGTAGYPFDSSTIVISSADQRINQQVRNALSSAGYDWGIMNDDNIPMNLVNMGLEKGKDTFLFVMRAQLWAQQDVGDAYIHNVEKYFKALRITPKRPIPIHNPWPVPIREIRETDKTEFRIVPNVVHDYNHLRNEIIKRYGSPDFDHVDLDTNIWIIDGYEGILQDVNVYGDDTDALYLKTDNFQLTTDDDFVIVYGINHEQTGKATFCQNSFYGAELWNGVAGSFHTVEFPNSAVEFFPQGYQNAKFYYAFKMARKADGDRVVVIPYSTGNSKGSAYGVDNNEEAYIGFRLYQDKETKVGPALYDVIWDNAILFTKKKGQRRNKRIVKEYEQDRSSHIYIKVGGTVTVI
ncbi:hypothetical protein [Sutcliffiella horikoshii]|uniref:hypothetical protein n=1 Tax=Sutcliffiella horikoshii TaxID=79883 RepID=UPI001F3FA965|nr:hypothetical protein [Sutcliffiella horikoshii]